VAEARSGGQIISADTLDRAYLRHDAKICTASGLNMNEKRASKDDARLPHCPPSEADRVMAQVAQTIDVARLQFKRLRGDLKECRSLPRNDASIRVFGDHSQDEDLAKSREIRTALFADVHFLLISLNETDKIVSRLKAIFPQEAELANLRNKYRPMLKRCAEFRNHLEKFDGNNGVEDFGDLAENVYGFHGKSLDLGPELEKNAEHFFCDVMSAWSRISDRQRRIRELICRTRTAG
jgi:hypothetical protein